MGVQIGYGCVPWTERLCFAYDMCTTVYYIMYKALRLSAFFMMRDGWFLRVVADCTENGMRFFREMESQYFTSLREDHRLYTPGFTEM